MEDSTMHITLTSTFTSIITSFVRGPPAWTFTTITRQLPDLAKASFPDPWQTATGANLAAMNEVYDNCLKEGNVSKLCNHGQQATSAQPTSSQYEASLEDNNPISSQPSSAWMATAGLDSSGTETLTDNKACVSAIFTTITIFTDVAQTGEANFASSTVLSPANILRSPSVVATPTIANTIEDAIINARGDTPEAKLNEVSLGRTQETPMIHPHVKSPLVI